MTDTSLHIDFPPEFHAILQSAAHARHVSVREFVRAALEAAIASEMKDTRVPNAVTRKAMENALAGENLKSWPSVDAMMRDIRDPT